MPVIWSRGAAGRGRWSFSATGWSGLQNKTPHGDPRIQGWIGLCCRLPPVLSVQKLESFRGPWQLETTGCSFPAPRCYVAMWSEHFRLVVLMVLYIYLLIRNQCIMRFISKSISLFILAGLGFWPQSPHVWPIPWCRGRCNALSSAYDAALSREHAAQRRVAKDSRCWEAVWEMISVGGDEQLATGITRYNSVYAMEKYVSHIHKPRTGPGSSYSDESSRVIDSWIINSPICIHNLVQTHLISLVIYPTIYIYHYVSNIRGSPNHWRIEFRCLTRNALFVPTRKRNGSSRWSKIDMRRSWMTSCFWGFKNPKTWGFHQQRSWIYRRFFCNKWNKWTHGDFTCKVGKSSQMFTVKSLEHQAFLEVQLPTPMAGMLWWPRWVLLPWKSWNEKVVNSIWRNDFPIFNSLRYWADTRFSLPPFFSIFSQEFSKIPLVNLSPDPTDPGLCWQRQLLCLLRSNSWPVETSDQWSTVLPHFLIYCTTNKTYVM